MKTYVARRQQPAYSCSARSLEVPPVQQEVSSVSTARASRLGHDIRRLTLFAASPVTVDLTDTPGPSAWERRPAHRPDQNAIVQRDEDEDRHDNSERDSSYGPVEAFLRGLLDGARKDLSDEKVRALEDKISAHTAALTVFGLPFTAGAVVGVGEELWNTVKGLIETVWKLDEILDQLRQIVLLLFSSESEQVAYELGHAAGKSFGSDLGGLSELEPFQFSYELGRRLGPSILLAVLTFVTAGAAAALVSGGRIARYATSVGRALGKLPGARGLLIAMRIRWYQARGLATKLPTPPMPPGMSPAKFGKAIGWGRKDHEARQRIVTLTREELQTHGVTREMAAAWRDFYVNEKARVPTNPSAQGRAELMQRAVELLSE